MARTRNSPALYELISDKHRPVRVHYTTPQPMPPPHTERAKAPAPSAVIAEPEPTVEAAPLFESRSVEPPAAAPAPPRREPQTMVVESAPQLDPEPVRVSPEPSRLASEPREPLFSADKVLGFITPGRSLRLPIGYVFIALAALIAIVVTTYSIGISNAEKKTRAAQEAEAARNAAGPITEPLDQPVPEINNTLLKSSTPRANQRVTVDDPAAPVTPAPPRPAQSRTGVDVVLVDEPADDPRQEGMNYYVVATQPQAEAERIAAFLAKNGVSAARLMPDRRGMCQVIALRAFPGGTLSSSETQQFKGQILKIGRDFRRTQQGATTDFSDMFPQKFRGSGG